MSELFVLNVPNLNDYLTKLILADLVKIVTARKAGHCIQVTDLPVTLMKTTCQQLLQMSVRCEAYVLSAKVSEPWQITATKLIERRNHSDVVIVLFIPPDLRTAAEDSFGVNTFEHFSITNLYSRLRVQLVSDVPLSRRGAIDEIIRESDCQDNESICRFLTAIKDLNYTSDGIGLSIHHLGLVPDPTLLNEPAMLRPNITRNLKAVRLLSLPDMGLLAKIQSLGVREGKSSTSLYHFFSQLGTFMPNYWLPAILEPQFDGALTFDQWEFEEAPGEIDEISILSFGGMGKNEDGYPLFDVQGTKHLKTAWETTPTPKQCQGLSHFTVELMKGGVAVTDARTVKVGVSLSRQRSTTLKDLNRLDLDDGLYYIRVNAWSSSGNLLRSAESESIFFRGGTEGDEDDTEGDGQSLNLQAVSTVYEAMLRAQAKLRKDDKTIIGRKTETCWVTSERRVGRRYTDQFNIKFSSANNFGLSVNAILRHIEEETLADADCLGRWELDLTRPVTAEIEPTLQPAEGIDYELLDQFLLIRKELFQMILHQQHNTEIQFLVETSDLYQFQKEIINYAEAYRAVLSDLSNNLAHTTELGDRQTLLRSNHQITSIDTVRLRLADENDAYIMLPTHPLKLLWGLQCARATHKWIDNLENLSPEQANWSIFSEFIPRLNSLNLPNTVISSYGTVLVNIDSFGPFWSIFVPVETTDARALVSRIKMALGSPEADERFTTISGLDLAQKIRRYLYQHPYVTTLRINAVQPGSGAILAEMLLDLEHYRPDLRYQLHLFSNDLNREELGAALDELMAPSEKRSGREELDAFLTASQNALFPKLVYSKHTLDDLLKVPSLFEAHVSLLFDVFHVAVQFAQPLSNARSNHLYGILNEYVEDFSTSGGEISWQRQINLTSGMDIDMVIPGHEMTVALYQEYSHLVAQISSEGTICKCIPTIRLPLGAIDKNLISEVHQVSDWVFTVDRNFGLEYMDSPFDSHCPVYLIDYQPEHLSQIGHRLIISTQHITEIERIIRPVLEHLDLPNRFPETQAIVNALRSVSGRLVLKLLSSPQMAHGALGMALARTFLEQAQLLKDMILIPLDAHPELFATARQEAERLGEELSLRRTDLLLVELEPNSSSITFHLIEVKFRQSARLSDILSLKQEITEQLDNSIQVLRRLFDPHFTLPDRYDRLIRTRELGVLLNFYLDRSVRHHLVSVDQVVTIKDFINHLEDGYTLHLTRSGIVLHLGENGYESEKDGEVVYHYLGLDRVKALIQVARVAEETKQSPEPDPAYSTTRGTFTRNPPNLGLQSQNTEVKPEENLAMGKEKIITPQENLVTDKVTNHEHPIAASADGNKLHCNVILGSKHQTPQYGILGRTGGQTVGLDINGTNAISLFGVQGSGKSYTLGTILEMAVMPIRGINQLPQPLGAVVFHYSKTEDYRPEFVSMVSPNTGGEVEELQTLYGANPIGLRDVILLVPQGKLAQRRKEFSGLPVYPISFDTSELDIEDWKFLMGVIGNDAMYIKKMNQIIRRIRGNLSLNSLYEGIAGASLSDAQTDLAHTRLEFAEEYICDGQYLKDHIRPGRLIIVDLRDELIEKSEALGLFMVMLKIFANTRYDGRPFNKLIVFDEAHKYIETAFIDDIVGVVREMRHKGTSVLIASQDPKSVPLPLIELSSMIILHQFSSPEWLKHIQKGAIALQDVTAGRLNMLQKGQAYIWSREATHHEFETRAVKVDIRPRITKHGGETIKAVDEV